MKTPQQKIVVVTLSIAALLSGGVFLWKKSPLSQFTQNEDGVVSDRGPAGNLPNTDSHAANGVDSSKQLSKTTGTANGAATIGNTTTAGSEESKPVTPESQCFLASFAHKKLPTHDDPETCQRHKNVIKLDHALKEMKNICVRIDGEAVEFQKVKNEPQQIMIAGGAGPDSKITVRYCLGNRPCPQECKIQVKKDNFMSAVGGQAHAKAKDAEDSPAKIMEWDPEKTNHQDKKLIQAVAKEIEGFQEDLKNEADERNEIFTSWLSGAAELSACSASATAQLNQ